MFVKIKEKTNACFVLFCSWYSNLNVDRYCAMVCGTGYLKGGVCVPWTILRSWSGQMK